MSEGASIASGAAAGASIGGGWGAVGGALVGGVAGLFGGGSSSSSGYSLPPEYELQYLQQFQQNMQQIQGAYQQAQQLSNIYAQRMNTIYGAMQGSLPTQQAMKQLGTSNMQLAQSLGMSAQDLVKNGFITQADHDQLTKMQDIASQANQGKFTDPVLEGQLKDQRRQLQQDLQRQGVPAAQQAIALSQFDRSSSEQRFQRSQELGSSTLNQMGTNLQLSSVLSQQGFNQSIGALGAGQSQYQAGLAGYGALASLSDQATQGQLGLLGAQQGLRTEASGQFAQMGQFKISDRTKAAIQSGLVGPGSYYQQTGVSGSVMGNYRDWVATQEVGSNRTPGGQTVDSSVLGYQNWYNGQKDAATGTTGGYNIKGMGTQTGASGSTGVAVNRFAPQQFAKFTNPDLATRT